MALNEEKIGKYVEENFKKLIQYLEQVQRIERAVEEQSQKDEPEEYNTARCQIDSLLFSFYSRGLNLKLESNEKLSYQLLLICSFTQSHYLINDIVRKGFYIDGLTLIRKQLEILTRLHEIDSKPLQKLERKTPNVINTLGKLGKSAYPNLSLVAHMASDKISHLMNINQHGDLIGPTPYPCFKEDVYQDVFNVHFCISAYFLGWLIKKQEDLLQQDFSEENQLLASLFSFLIEKGMLEIDKSKE